MILLLPEVGIGYASFMRMTEIPQQENVSHVEKVIRMCIDQHSGHFENFFVNKLELE